MVFYQTNQILICKIKEKKQKRPHHAKVKSPKEREQIMPKKKKGNVNIATKCTLITKEE